LPDYSKLRQPDCFLDSLEWYIESNVLDAFVTLSKQGAGK
jgi:hypothetical protein